MFTARYGLIPYIKQIFITVLESVYSAVRIDSLYKADYVLLVVLIVCSHTTVMVSWN
jgi:hypothetical protein